MPTDLLAGLLMAQAEAPAGRPRQIDRLRIKVYAVMTATSLLTFATLTTGYQLLFPHQLFA